MDALLAIAGQYDSWLCLTGVLIVFIWILLGVHWDLNPIAVIPVVLVGAIIVSFGISGCSFKNQKEEDIHKQRFYAQCLEDHKAYECDLKWKQLNSVF